MLSFEAASLLTQLCRHALYPRSPSHAFLLPSLLPPGAVFTSAVGNEALTAVIVLSIAPILVEAKNALSGTDEEVGARHRSWAVLGVWGSYASWSGCCMPGLGQGSPAADGGWVGWPVALCMLHDCEP